MASWSPEPDAGAPCFSVFRGCSSPKTASGLLVAFSGLVEPRAPGRLSSGSSARGVSTSEGAVSGGAAAAKGPCVGLPRNVLSERERRKRISASCERLRTLLPQFEGRREDMASVLEMAVQFLQLARRLASGWEQPGTLQLPVSAKDAWSPWCQSIRHLTLASQSPAAKPSSEADAPGDTSRQDPHLDAVLGTEESKATPGLVKGLDVLSPSPGLTPGQPPRPAPWQPSLGQLASSEAREEAPGVQGPAGQSLRARGAASPGRKAEEAELALPRVPSARSVPGPDVEEGSSFLLTASPDWWLGSLDNRGRGAPSWAASRSSLVPGMEPGFPSDPEPGPGPQELPDGPLEPWGSDVGGLGLALREETDSIFPDFLVC
ncbi:spermatogenesis- and oogenesis-specific basic helix-loop-helix-containing protein 1 [Ochotona curzoniae]|uniref:spermatogenesis- and oogenesis-specific basic helix-loop-helix-containing protein 1 n=1 Tax=Ochotona curzoniae TaxID=130825 RepID=UPI001B34DC11|nr:spermatogenesis- and oogenesis-specific basic helix-loop-helix-containing protein 1 [Ochotona curzoniae]